jgi:sulfhydrogenase subunit alpha
MPDLERDTEYISLQSDDEFALYDGYIYSSDTGRDDHKNYRKYTNEFCVPHSTAKHAKANRASFMVGALARVNNNFDKLSPLAKNVASAVGFKAPIKNPYYNNVAQLIETAHCFEESIKMLHELTRKGLKEEKPIVKVKAGTGVGAVEVPRGILYHEYSYNSEGILTDANCIIPTGQNLENIELDMKKLVPEIIEKENEPEITKKLEMLVRAYDPCISCSTHLLNVEFDK